MPIIICMIFFCGTENSSLLFPSSLLCVHSPHHQTKHDKSFRHDILMRWFAFLSLIRALLFFQFSCMYHELWAYTINSYETHKKHLSLFFGYMCTSPIIISEPISSRAKSYRKNFSAPFQSNFTTHTGRRGKVFYLLNWLLRMSLRNVDGQILMCKVNISFIPQLRLCHRLASFSCAVRLIETWNMCKVKRVVDLSSHFASSSEW